MFRSIIKTTEPTWDQTFDLKADNDERLDHCYVCVWVCCSVVPRQRLMKFCEFLYVESLSLMKMRWLSLVDVCFGFSFVDVTEIQKKLDLFWWERNICDGGGHIWEKYVVGFDKWMGQVQFYHNRLLSELDRVHDWG